ncbi:MAG: alpha/beta hydrolase [Proteobacteria bacterium]|nr:alpha/beta hydrolase [Pseudomonadota bacterium]
MEADKFEHAYADLDGVRLHYARAGEGELVVFVHGFPEFWYAWKNQLAEFSRDHLAVAYDTRGINLSSKPEGVSDYAPKHLIADLKGLIAHLGHQLAVVVGHDWGGVGAWAFALAHPDMVAKLVIINAPHPGVFTRLLREDRAQQKASGYMLKYRSAEAEDYLLGDGCAELRKSILDPGRAQGYFDDQDAAQYLAAWTQPGAMTAALNYYRAMRMTPPHKDGTPAQAPGIDPARLTVRVPTLVVWGMKDRFLLPQNLDGLEDYVPDLRVHRSAEGSHWVIHECPDEVNRTLRAFLDGEI